MRHPSRFEITLHAEGQAADAYASADQAALRVERRLRRYHRRLKEHRSDRLDGRAALEAASYIIAAPEQDSEAELDGFTPVIIAEIDHQAEAISVSDAVMELDMTGAPVLVFRHAAHGGINSSIGAPMGISVGSIRPRRQRRKPIDGAMDPPYGPPPSATGRGGSASQVPSMPLTDLVAPNAIIPALKVNNKKQALQELAARAAGSAVRTSVRSSTS